MSREARLTAAIPTYRRGEILLRTVTALLSLETAPDEILIVDQTERHPPHVESELRRLSEQQTVRVIRLARPSIPHAMNVALVEATHPVVLFLDDDVEPSRQLVAAHLIAYAEHSVSAVVGQILQPGELPTSIAQPRDPLEFYFNSSEGSDTRNVMAGNLSVIRDTAVQLGGFDENFVGAAYRFETDFALRMIAAGHRIWFSPKASLRHLKLSSGGLRAFGAHLTSAGPEHCVGDYYFALRHVHRPSAYMLRRLRRNVLTRYHLRHPWTIPFKIIGELRGIVLARKLNASGPRLIDVDLCRTV